MGENANLLYSRWAGFVVCILGFGLSVWAFYPGMMSSDSFASLQEGQTGIFYDQTSPVMSYLWGFLDGYVQGPGLMFMLQNAVVWSACALFWHATNRTS